MRTMSKRFIKKWRQINNRVMPGWMYHAIAHDADIRCKDVIKKRVND